MTAMGILCYALLCCQQINTLAAIEVGLAGLVCLCVLVFLYVFDFPS